MLVFWSWFCIKELHNISHFVKELKLQVFFCFFLPPKSPFKTCVKPMVWKHCAIPRYISTSFRVLNLANWHQSSQHDVLSNAHAQICTSSSCRCSGLEYPFLHWRGLSEGDCFLCWECFRNSTKAQKSYPGTILSYTSLPTNTSQLDFKNINS